MSEKNNDQEIDLVAEDITAEDLQDEQIVEDVKRRARRRTSQAAPRNRKTLDEARVIPARCLGSRGQNKQWRCATTVRAKARSISRMVVK